MARCCLTSWSFLYQVSMETKCTRNKCHAGVARGQLKQAHGHGSPESTKCSGLRGLRVEAWLENAATAVYSPETWCILGKAGANIIAVPEKAVGTKSLAVEAATLVTLGVAEPLCEARRVGMLQVRPRTADVGRMHPGFGHLALQVSPIRAVSSQYRPAKL